MFVGLLPLFDPPRHDSAETIRRALNLGVNVKMITGDQLAIAKETGRRLGMGTNMYPSSTLLGQTKDETTANLPVEELIEKADGFAGVFPGEWTTSSYFIGLFLWSSLAQATVMIQHFEKYLLRLGSVVKKIVPKGYSREI